MQRVRLHIDTDGLLAGETAVLVASPAADAALSESHGVAGGRRVPVAAENENAEHGFEALAPGTLGTNARELPAEIVLTPELGPGLHKFATRLRAPDDGAQWAASGEAQLYLNTSPAGATLLRPVEALVGGKLKFTYKRVSA